MSSQDQMALTGGGDCPSWSVGTKNQKTNSATTFGVSKGWASADSNSAPPMSKATVANLLRQMKGFVSSDVTIEQNEPADNYWGVGEGPVLKGWGQLPRKSTARNGSATEDCTQIETQHVSPLSVTSNKPENKITRGWGKTESSAASTTNSNSGWGATPVTQFGWTGQQTTAAAKDSRATVVTMKDSAAKAVATSNGISPPLQGGEVPPKMPPLARVQKNTNQTASGRTGVNPMDKAQFAAPATLSQTSASKVPPAKLVYGCASVQSDGPPDVLKARPNITRSSQKNTSASRRPSVPFASNVVVATHAAIAAAAAAVSVADSDTTQPTNMKAPSWGTKFTPSGHPGPEALRRWTESPPPTSASPISSSGEPNKMVYVSKWLHDQTSDEVSPPPVPITPPPASCPAKVNLAVTTQCSTQRVPRPPGTSVAAMQPGPTSDHLHKINVISDEPPSESAVDQKLLPASTPQPNPTAVEAPEASDESLVIVQSKEQKLSVLVDLVQTGLEIAEYAAATNGVDGATNNGHNIENPMTAQSSVRVLIVVDSTLWDPEGIRTWLTMCGLMKEPDVCIVTTEELLEAVCAAYNVSYLINVDVLASLEEHAQRLKLLDHNGIMKTLFDPVTESEKARVLALQLRRCGFCVPQALRQSCQV